MPPSASYPYSYSPSAQNQDITMARPIPPAFQCDYIELTPPSGSRFSIFGATLRLDYAKGQRDAVLRSIVDQLVALHTAPDDTLVSGTSPAAKTE